jgi:uncharacterized tellurite resistance protein B-like protein
MSEPREDRWTNMHDVAMIYIACMHGGDGEIEPVEEERILQLLGERYPELDEADAQRVLSRALLSYVGNSGPELLMASIQAAGEELSSAERVQIVRELTRIASADGLIYPGEASFISTVANLWGIQRHLSGD